jgi:hypothetical protein
MQVIHTITRRVIHEEQRTILVTSRHCSPNLGAKLLRRVDGTKQRALQLSHLLRLFVLLGFQRLDLLFLLISIVILLSPLLLSIIIAMFWLGFVASLCIQSNVGTNAIRTIIITSGFPHPAPLERVLRYYDSSS